MTRSEYLKECIRNAKEKLAGPDFMLPNGKMIHAHMREQLPEFEAKLQDYALDHGRWYADGRFAGFAPGR
jgi:hypothetical protein